MAKRLPIDPLYSASPQPLTRAEKKRMAHYDRPFVTRSCPYPVDRFVAERKQRRELLILDVALAIEWVIIVLCLVKVILG